MDFTADFKQIFMINPPDFIIDFIAISLHLPGFHQNQKHFMRSTGFHLNQQDFIMDFTLDSIPVADPQISCLKSKRFHEIHPIS